MEVILDSSFIMSCIRARIDFLTQLEEQGFKIVVPREVLQEIKDLKSSAASQDDRIAANVALELIEKNKLKKISFGKGKVDDYLIKKGLEGAYIATLDKEIKRNVPNKVVIFKSKSKVGIE